MSWLRITKDDLGKVFYKQGFNDGLDWNTCRVLKKGVTIEKINFAELTSLPFFQPINELKKQDLHNMLEYIDEENLDFFKSILFYFIFLFYLDFLRVHGVWIFIFPSFLLQILLLLLDLFLFLAHDLVILPWASYTSPFIHIYILRTNF